jgi:hypothetical protein
MYHPMRSVNNGRQVHSLEVTSGMAGEKSPHEEWEQEHHLSAREAQEADDQWRTGPAAYRQHEQMLRDNPDTLEEPAVDWSDQPTHPHRRIEAWHDWPPHASGQHPEWPLRAAAASTAASPLHRLLDAARERQFSLGCGAVAALVLIVAALLAAFTNGWLPSSAGPIGPQPSSQANPIQSTTPTPAITPRPSPTATPVPTDTPIPTETPAPNVTPFPTESPIPTQTPVPSPTATPLPTETPTPAQEPAPTPTLP